MANCCNVYTIAVFVTLAVAELEKVERQTLFTLEAQHQFDMVPESIKPGCMPSGVLYHHHNDHGKSAIRLKFH